MVKHTQIIRQFLLTNCLSVFDHFVGLAQKGLKNVYPVNVFCRKSAIDSAKQEA